MRTWNERYLMGIPDLDQDHQRLFKICERIINRVREKGEDEATRMFLLREGVHFLQGYFAHHSAREEAYMLKIGYADYALHKSLHDDFNELLESRYEAMVKNGQCSHRDILDFVGTGIGWLLDHVATADMAIVGKGILREKAEERSGSYIIRQDVLEKELNHLFTATLNIEVNARIINPHYAGERFGKAIFQRILYERENRDILVVSGIERSFVLDIAKDLYGESAEDEVDLVLSTVKTFGSQFWSTLFYQLTEDKIPIHVKDSQYLMEGEVAAEIEKIRPTCSMLFRSDKGMFFLSCNSERLFMHPKINS